MEKSCMSETTVNHDRQPSKSVKDATAERKIKAPVQPVEAEAVHVAPLGLVPPLGFVFSPTDPIAIGILRRMTMCGKLPPNMPHDIIIHADVYSQHPEAIIAKLVKSGADRNRKEWYFFTKLQPLHTSGSANRPRRTAGGGTWKSQAKKSITDNKEELIGFRTSLAYFVNGRKTPWLMIEYRLNDDHQVPTQSDGNDDKPEELVICKIYETPRAAAAKDDPDTSNNAWLSHLQKHYQNNGDDDDDGQIHLNKNPDDKPEEGGEDEDGELTVVDHDGAAAPAADKKSVDRIEERSNNSSDQKDSDGDDGSSDQKDSDGDDGDENVSEGQERSNTSSDKGNDDDDDGKGNANARDEGSNSSSGQEESEGHNDNNNNSSPRQERGNTSSNEKKVDGGDDNNSSTPREERGSTASNSNEKKEDGGDGNDNSSSRKPCGNTTSNEKKKSYQGNDYYNFSCPREKTNSTSVEKHSRMKSSKKLMLSCKQQFNKRSNREVENLYHGGKRHRY